MILKIRCKAKKEGKNVECMGHRDVAASSVAIHRWDHVVWTCDPAYSGKTWDGLKEDCHILKRNRSTTKVCGSKAFLLGFIWPMICHHLLFAGSHQKWRGVPRSKSHGGGKSTTVRSQKKMCAKASNGFWP